MKIIKKMLIAMLVIAGIFVFTACSSNENEEAEQPTITKYKVDIGVKCTENIFLSKYDVKVFLDDKNELGTIEHGDSVQYSVDLEQGEYELRVESEEDNSIDGTVKFTVSDNNIALRYILTCSSDQIEIEEVKQISPPVVSDDLGKIKYKKTKKKFEDAGFTNIKLKEVCSLSEEELDNKSVVKKILIDGKYDYTKSDKFFKDSKVVIRYYSAKRIHPPRGQSSCEGKKYRRIVKEFKDAGFINVKVKTTEGYDKSDVGKVESVDIGSYFWFSKKDKIPLDEKIIVYRYVFEETDNEENSGNSSYSSDSTKYAAQKAFEAVGEHYYPYGFECHWYLDCRNAEEQSNGSWFFKVGVTIENAYGNKIDAIAEGTVLSDGTVKNFYVN